MRSTLTHVVDLPKLSSTQSWCCGNGCGEAKPVQAEHDYSVEHDEDGNVTSRKAELVWVSCCCHASLHVWDESAGDFVPFPTTQDKETEMEAPKLPASLFNLYESTGQTLNSKTVGHLTVSALTRAGLAHIGDNGGEHVFDPARDEPHRFLVYAPSTTDAPNVVGDIRMQCGPVKEVGLNGVSLEVLLEVSHMFLGELNGKFPCQENAEALSHLSLAIEALNSRTRKREARGVEGTNQA